VSAEQDLLRALQAVLTDADVDVSDLVEGAWADAQEEVRGTLRRLMVRDLLARSIGTLEGTAPPPPADAPPRATDLAEPAEGPRREADEAGTLAGGIGPGIGSEAQLTYVFGVVGPETSLPRTELPTLPGGGPIRLLDVGAGRALVSDVDPSIFAVLREPGPEGLDVLAAAAQVHDVVLARFVDAPVLPLPLGSALPDDRTVVDLLDRHAERLRAELERLTGLSEWAVTVRTVERSDPSEADPPPASGRDYLESRRAALRDRDRRWASQEQLIGELHEPLAACAVEAYDVPSRPIEDATPPLLHGVYLVTDDARDRFRSTVDYLRGEHPDAVIEVTGPWPPYHFTAVELTADDRPAT
jgi:hypothetical protein